MVASGYATVFAPHFSTIIVWLHVVRKLSCTVVCCHVLAALFGLGRWFFCLYCLLRLLPRELIAFTGHNCGSVYKQNKCTNCQTAVTLKYPSCQPKNSLNLTHMHKNTFHQLHLKCLFSPDSEGELPKSRIPAIWKYSEYSELLVLL